MICWFPTRSLSLSLFHFLNIHVILLFLHAVIFPLVLCLLDCTSPCSPQWGTVDYIFCAYSEDANSNAAATAVTSGSLSTAVTTSVFGSTTCPSVSGRSLLCSDVTSLGNCYSGGYTCSVNPYGKCSCAAVVTPSNTPSSLPTYAPTSAPSEEVVSMPTPTAVPTRESILAETITVRTCPAHPVACVLVCACVCVCVAFCFCLIDC